MLNNQLSQEQVFVGQLLNWVMQNPTYLDVLDDTLAGVYTNDPVATQNAKKLMTDVSRLNGPRDFLQRQQQQQQPQQQQPQQRQPTTTRANPVGTPECDSDRDCNSTYGRSQLCANMGHVEHPELGFIYGGNCEPCPSTLLGLWEMSEETSQNELGHQNSCVKEYIKQYGSGDCAVPFTPKKVNAPASHRSRINSIESHYSGPTYANCE